MNRHAIRALPLFFAASAAIFAFGQAPAPSPAPAPQDGLAKVQTQLDRDEKILQDWANLGRYREENSKLAAPAAGENRVVFMGDSITDGWGRRYGQFFPGKPYVNRGISGQTTPQMLVRFRPDVVNLKPTVVVILAGTNDIAGNTGPESLEDIENNMASIEDLARGNGVRVVLASLTPVCDYIKPQTARRPPEKIVKLNEWIKNFCDRKGDTYLDYYSAMIDDQRMFKRELTYDGLHPNALGYEIMGPLAEKAIAQALASNKQ